jgi:alanyl-tRNA synthetase
MQLNAKQTVLLLPLLSTHVIRVWFRAFVLSKENNQLRYRYFPKYHSGCWKLSGKKYGKTAHSKYQRHEDVAMRVTVDHIRAVAFILLPEHSPPQRRVPRELRRFAVKNVLRFREPPWRSSHLFLAEQPKTFSPNQKRKRPVAKVIEEEKTFWERWN